MVTDQGLVTSHATPRPGLPRVVRVLVLARAVNRVAAFTLPFLALLLTQEHGWSTAAAGALLTGFGLAAIPSRLLGGRLADTRGRRTTMVLGLSGCAAAQLALAGATSTIATIVAVLALGLCFEIYEPPSQALIADHVPVEDQPTAHGLMAAALAGAAVAAGGLATLLAGIDLRWLFVADAASCIACALIVLRAVPAGGRPESEADNVDASIAPSVITASPWRDRRLLTLLAVQTCFAVVYLQSTIALPLSLIERGRPPWTVGVLLVASAITMLVTAPVMRLDPFRSWARTTQLRVGYLILGTGLGGYAVAESLTAYVAASAVAAVGDLLLIGLLLTAVAGLAPAQGRARYLAVFGLSWGIAGVLAPAVGVALLGTVGVGATWWVLAGGCVTLGLLAQTYLPRSA
jgi:MFS family permease